LLGVGSRAANNTVAISMLAVSAGFSAFAGASWWAACIDLTPNHSGSLSGLMNTCANIAGGIAPVLTAYVATAFGWTRALELGAFITFIGGLLWLLVDADQRLESELNSGSGHRSDKAAVPTLGSSPYPIK
jgi:ACS family glucarate transporter-like MFS transporter